MTEENTAAPVVETPAPAPVAGAIPGNPGQTQATVKRLVEDPEVRKYIFEEVKRQTGEAASEQSDRQLAQQALLENALLKSAMANGIPLDKMHLVKGATPDEIAAHAAELGPLLRPAPTATAAPVDMPAPATPAEPTRPAGIPLPAAIAPPAFDRSSPKSAADALEQYTNEHIAQFVPIPKL